MGARAGWTGGGRGRYAARCFIVFRKMLHTLSTRRDRHASLIPAQDSTRRVARRRHRGGGHDRRHDRGHGRARGHQTGGRAASRGRRHTERRRDRQPVVLELELGRRRVPRPPRPGRLRRGLGRPARRVTAPPERRLVGRLPALQLPPQRALRHPGAVREHDRHLPCGRGGGLHGRRRQPHRRADRHRLRRHGPGRQVRPADVRPRPVQRRRLRPHDQQLGRPVGGPALRAARPARPRHERRRRARHDRRLPQRPDRPRRGRFPGGRGQAHPGRRAGRDRGRAERHDRRRAAVRVPGGLPRRAARARRLLRRG